MSRWLTALVALAVATGAVSAQEVYVDNVVIVLDASGSMRNTMGGTSVQRIDAAKKAIKAVVQTIPASTHIGLLVFGGQANRWVYPLGPRDDARLFAAVDKLGASGGTPLGEYMKRAGDKLLEARGRQYGYGTYRLLVVTDGEAGDRELVDRFTPDIMSRGIVTDVIGVDMGTDHTLATRVHSYRRANDPQALTRAVQEVFAEVGKADGGGGGQDVFEELAELPEGIAEGLIAGLAGAGNKPIGSGLAAAGPARPASAAPSASPVSPAASSSGNRGGGGWMRVVILVVVLAALYASAMARWKKK